MNGTVYPHDVKNVETHDDERGSYSDVSNDCVNLVCHMENQHDEKINAATCWA